jgi:hypothetical protein
MIVPALSRSAMIVGMRVLPYARGKEGTGSPFFETPLSTMDFKYLAAPVVLSLFLGWRGLLMNLVFALATAILVWFYRKKLGGITGDLLGAMVEILEAILFLALCVGGSHDRRTRGQRLPAGPAELGCRPSDISDMSANVNPLGPMPALIDHLKENMSAIAALPEVDAGGIVDAFSRFTASIRGR